jgi:hypothetical protein
LIVKQKEDPHDVKLYCFVSVIVIRNFKRELEISDIFLPLIPQYVTVEGCYPFFKAWERILVAREEEANQPEAAQVQAPVRVG